MLIVSFPVINIENPWIALGWLSVEGVTGEGAGRVAGLWQSLGGFFSSATYFQCIGV